MSLTLATMLLAALFAAGAAWADVTRTCRATWRIAPTDFSGAIVTRQFRATGTDPINPNWARTRARLHIEDCVRGHWELRLTDGPHRSCRLGERVFDYPFTRLDEEITALICDANPDRERMTVEVKVVLGGDTGCYGPSNQWAIMLAEDYPITCRGPATIREVPSLTRVDEPPLPETRLPGGDLALFVASAPDWHLCEDACMADDGCAAWTFRPHEAVGPVCLLKHTVGVRVADPCCSSGIK